VREQRHVAWACLQALQLGIQALSTVDQNTRLILKLLEAA
jgi:hypothetical protein